MNKYVKGESQVNPKLREKGGMGGVSWGKVSLGLRPE